MLSWLRNNQSTIVIGVSIFACLLLSLFFLNSSAFSFDSLLLLDIKGIKSLAFSAEFWLATLFFSFATGLSLALPFKFGRKVSFALTLGFLGLAYLLAFFIFPIAKQLFVVFLFYLLGLFWAEEIVRTRITELRRFPVLRSVNTALEKLVLILSIGFFVLGVFMVMPEKESYVEKFEEKFILGTISEGSVDIVDAAVNLKINTEYALLEEIKNSKEFEALRKSQSEVDQNFVEYIFNKILKVSSPEYKETAKNDLKKKFKNVDTMQIVRENIPLYGLFAKYIYIVLPFGAFCIVWLFSSIFLRTFSLIVGVIAAKTI